MIWQPKIGQQVEINYKDKSMPHQGRECEVVAVSNGRGPKNALVKIMEFGWIYEIIPRGNLNVRKST